MGAVVMTEDGALNYEEVPVPVIGDSEVLIDVMYSGVCGTDLHIIKREFPAMTSGIMGHEFWGHVCAVGSDVKDLVVGQAVAVDPNEFCSTCRYCRSGRTNHCVRCQLHTAIGIRRNGGWSKYCVVPAFCAVPISSSLANPAGVIVEPMSCIVNGYDRMQQPAADANVLVLGAGIIGLLWLSLLHHRGHRRLTISEPKEGRRIIAEGLSLCGVRVVSPREAKAACPNPEGYDMILDCSGVPSAIEAAFSWLAPGATFLQFGCCPKGSSVTVDPHEIFAKELRIVGSKIDKFSMTKAAQVTEDMVPSYLNDLSRLGIEIFLPSQHQEALAKLEEGRISKAIFDFSAAR